MATHHPRSLLSGSAGRLPTRWLWLSEASPAVVALLLTLHCFVGTLPACPAPVLACAQTKTWTCPPVRMRPATTEAALPLALKPRVCRDVTQGKSSNGDRVGPRPSAGAAVARRGAASPFGSSTRSSFFHLFFLHSRARRHPPPNPSVSRGNGLGAWQRPSRQSYPVSAPCWSTPNHCRVTRSCTFPTGDTPRQETPTSSCTTGHPWPLTFLIFS